MDKQSKNIEEFTRKVIKEAGVSKPSGDFTSRVMEMVDKKATPAVVYKPLISKRSWGIIALITAACLVGFYFVPVGNQSLSEIMEITQKMEMNLNIPEVRISKTFTYAIGFLALFLVQIPFLKHYLLKRYN